MPSPDAFLDECLDDFDETDFFLLFDRIDLEAQKMVGLDLNTIQIDSQSTPGEDCTTFATSSTHETTQLLTIPSSDFYSQEFSPTVNYQEPSSFVNSQESSPFANYQEFSPFGSSQEPTSPESVAQSPGRSSRSRNQPQKGTPEYEAKRLKNREAAEKHQQKKKRQIQENIKRLHEREEQKKALSNKAIKLKMIIYAMNSYIYSNTSCGLEPASQ